MFRFAATRVTRFTLAPLLVFWIAGMPCLLGCGMVAQAAPNTEDQNLQGDVVANESCASSKSHDCCAKQKPRRETTTKQADSNERVLKLADLPSGSMGECPMAVNAIAAISKVRYDDSAPIALTPNLKTLVRVADQHIPLSEPLHLPNRGHTYLRCCVFLI